MKSILGIVFMLMVTNVFSADDVVVRPDPRTIVSAFGVHTGVTPLVIIYTVPNGKLFILTDVINSSSGGTRISSSIGGDKIQIEAHSSSSFAAGIPFVSGSEIAFTRQSQNVFLTISGYLDDE